MENNMCDFFMPNIQTKLLSKYLVKMLEVLGPNKLYIPWIFVTFF
jgi:hypothetical protein